MTFLVGPRALVRWVAFVACLAVVFTLPPALLWNVPGLVAGLTLTAIVIFSMAWRGPRRVARRLGVRPLEAAQAPVLHAIVTEHCRRLRMPVPHVGVIETPALNIAVFGFSARNSWLVVTRGTLLAMKRGELSALMGRALTHLWSGDAYGETWLAQFLAILDRWLLPTSPRMAHTRRVYPFRLFLRQVVLYPLTLLPAFLLRGRSDAIALDFKSVRLTRRPRDFTEALRRIDANLQRTPFRVPLSARHLFLVPPPAIDPLARVFFEAEDLAPRISAVDKAMTRVTPLEVAGLVAT